MKKHLIFSTMDCHRHIDQYQRDWELTDRTLYSLCRDNYFHDSTNAINAKLWIISRAYATGIERKIKSNGYQGGSLSQLARHLYDIRQVVDDIFKTLKSLSSQTALTVEVLEVIVRLHGQFVAMIKEITRKKQSSRSFVSKYMHFHCPLVPIYDSFALSTLNRLVPWDNRLIVFDKPALVDVDYLWFVLRFWELYKRASESIVDLKVKHLDYHLLCVADELKMRADDGIRD